jgi:hypothetical protein
MENKNYNIVIDYIDKEFNLKKRKIDEETTLSDLGLDGDDVLDFLLEFFKTFNIEYEQTNYKDFIPKECGFLFNTLLSIFGKKEQQNEDEIYVKDLVISLDKKKWYKKKNTKS